MKQLFKHLQQVNVLHSLFLNYFLTLKVTGLAGKAVVHYIIMKSYLICSYRCLKQSFHLGKFTYSIEKLESCYTFTSSETLATNKLTLFCPLLFGAPYHISFSVYALGKQVDSGLLPDHFLENEIQAANTVSDLLKTLFSLQLCLGIYDKKLLKMVKVR